jgi:DNA invertase Pin-like site-specific DNA recombinase
MKKACLWLRVSTDGKGQDPALQQADLEKLCQQRDWEVVQTYKVEESAFGKKPRPQFQSMLEEAHRGKFNIIVAWSMDRFSREGGWSVAKVIATLLEWNVQFYSYNEPFLDTTGPFSAFFVPLWAFMAREDSLRKSRAVKLGMEKAKAHGARLGRPRVAEQVDGNMVRRLRERGNSWRAITLMHPRVRSASGKWVNPSIGSIRRSYSRS